MLRRSRLLLCEAQERGRTRRVIRMDGVLDVGGRSLSRMLGGVSQLIVSGIKAFRPFGLEQFSPAMLGRIRAFVGREVVGWWGRV